VQINPSITQTTTKPDSPVYLSAAQVALRYGLVSDKTAWRWAKSDPTFPAPVKLTPRCVRWRLADLVAWEARK
jgi:predicted DNA-binding transcriptional regulator AlpA